MPCNGLQWSAVVQEWGVQRRGVSPTTSSCASGALVIGRWGNHTLFLFHPDTLLVIPHLSDPSSSRPALLMTVPPCWRVGDGGGSSPGWWQWGTAAKRRPGEIQLFDPCVEKPACRDHIRIVYERRRKHDPRTVAFMKLLGDIASSHKLQRERDALYLVQTTHRASTVQAEARKEVGRSQTMLEERTE
ncbi:hypothetical protein B0O80DRAFT_423812 [Mortierella sp. GBAus27b]|nr:hypothetical protein B0O80DRAFT_423812 [Mortierella sp. GBAus27b]